MNIALCVLSAKHQFLLVDILNHFVENVEATHDLGKPSSTLIDT